MFRVVFSWVFYNSISMSTLLLFTSPSLAIIWSLSFDFFFKITVLTPPRRVYQRIQRTSPWFITTTQAITIDISATTNWLLILLKPAMSVLRGFHRAPTSIAMVSSVSPRWRGFSCLRFSSWYIILDNIIGSLLGVNLNWWSVVYIVLLH